RGTGGSPVLKHAKFRLVANTANSARLAPVSAPSSNSARKALMVRFGVFEADLEARELRKQGRRLRLQDQPFAVLALLLERPGVIVTREELRQKLWPADTFVDFDHSLNTAVNKIREDLGDSAPSPRFVETIARRGYRFLGELRSDSDAPVDPSAQAAAVSTPRPDVIADRGVVRALFSVLQVMYLIFYVEALLHWRAVDRMEVFNIAAPLVLVTVLVSAAVGIPLRFYLLAGVAFDHAQLGIQFQKIFLGV